MEQSIYDNTIVTVFDQLHTGSACSIIVKRKSWSPT